MKKMVTDEEISLAMKPIHASLEKYLVKMQPIKEEEPKEAKKRRKRKKQAQHERNTSSSKARKQSEDRGSSEQQIELTRLMKEYLESVYEKPNLALTPRGELLGLSADKRTKIKNFLLENGFVAEFSVDLGKEFGGRVKMLRLTNAGFRAIGKEPPPPFPKSQGSFEHIWWQVHIAKDYADRGYRANVERILNGKPADIGVSNGKEIVAVEVELSPRNIIHNLKSDIDAGFSRVIVACKNTRVQKEAEKQITAFIKNNPSYAGKYIIVLLKDFPFVKNLMKEVRGE